MPRWRLEGDVDQELSLKGIGGPKRMPIVRQLVESVMGKEPERGIDPMEAVAMGVPVQGAVDSGGCLN